VIGVLVREALAREVRRRKPLEHLLRAKGDTVVAVEAVGRQRHLARVVKEPKRAAIVADLAIELRVYRHRPTAMPPHTGVFDLEGLLHGDDCTLRACARLVRLATSPAPIRRSSGE
jgi:hypothetical protein